jgi:hypothetical protein
MPSLSGNYRSPQPKETNTTDATTDDAIEPPLGKEEEEVEEREVYEHIQVMWW